MLSADVQNIKQPTNIALLTISLGLFPVFGLWMQYQEKRHKPALIPNSLWKNIAFTSICIMVMLCIAVQNSMEQFCSLFFQEVQGTSALGASFRILPSLIIGIFLSVATGFLVNRAPVMYSILIGTGLCAASPILMAVINPKWPYWYDAFVAQAS